MQTTTPDKRKIVKSIEQSTKNWLSFYPDGDFHMSFLGPKYDEKSGYFFGREKLEFSKFDLFWRPFWGSQNSRSGLYILKSSIYSRFFCRKYFILGLKGFSDVSDFGRKSWFFKKKSSFSRMILGVIWGWLGLRLGLPGWKMVQKMRNCIRIKISASKVYIY